MGESSNVHLQLVRGGDAPVQHRADRVMPSGALILR